VMNNNKQLTNRNRKQGKKKNKPVSNPYNYLSYYSNFRPDVEYRCIDTMTGVIGPTTSGVVTLINGVGQGDDTTQRQGRQITMRRLELRLQCRQDQLNGDSGYVLRMVIAYDRQATGVSATAGTILDLSTIGQGHIAPINYQNIQRYEILYDKSFTVNATAGIVGAFDNQILYKTVIMDLNHVVRYIGTGATISSINSGSLNVLLTAGGYITNSPDAFFGARVYFSDM